MSKSVRFDAVDRGTLASVRDITPIITVDDGAYIEQSLGSAIFTSGEASFAGSRSWLNQLIRVSVCDDDGTQEVLGTFFPTLTDLALVTREVVAGKLRLDGTLVALQDTLLPTSYAISSGASSIDVITDMCRLAGVQANLDPAEGNYRFTDSIFYDVGESALNVASEAAELANIRLLSDRLGYVTARGNMSFRGGARFVSGSSDTDVVSEISKSFSFLTSPTRLIASYSSSDRTLFTTIDATGSQDAETRGRNFDTSISVNSLPVESLEALRIVAQDALREQMEETWSFSCLHRLMDAGDLAQVRDFDADELLDGTIQSVKTYLSGLCEQEVTIKGSLS